MPMPAIVTPPISPATYVDPVEDYDPYYLDNLNEDPFEGVEIDGIPFGELMDGDNFPPPPLVRSTNLIEDFDAEWDEDYLPEPPVLAREDATSHVWSVLPDPLEIIPNHTINNPNPANVIIYNEPRGGKRTSLLLFRSQRFPLPFRRQMKRDFAILRIYTETHTRLTERTVCIWFVKPTRVQITSWLAWNTDEGVPEFYPDYRP